MTERKPTYKRKGSSMCSSTCSNSCSGRADGGVVGVEILATSCTRLDSSSHCKTFCVAKGGTKAETWKQRKGANVAAQGPAATMATPTGTFAIVKFWPQAWQDLAAAILINWSTKQNGRSCTTKPRNTGVGLIITDSVCSANWNSRSFYAQSLTCT